MYGQCLLYGFDAFFMWFLVYRLLTYYVQRTAFSSRSVISFNMLMIWAEFLVYLCILASSGLTKKSTNLEIFTVGPQEPETIGLPWGELGYIDFR